MDQVHEYRGYWWLPSNPKIKIAGILKYTPTESIILELIGSFSKHNIIDTLQSTEPEETILGISSEAKEITLLHCYSSGSLNFSCPFPIIRYKCSHLIVGDHIKSIESKKFFKVFIKIPILTKWYYPEAISFNIPPSNDTEKIITLFLATNKKAQVEVPIDDFKLYIKPSVDYKLNLEDSHISQYSALVIESENNLSINRILNLIHLFCQFLSFATLNLVGIKKIILYNKERYQILENNKNFKSIEYYIINSEISPFEELRKKEFLFNFRTIEKEYNQIISKWFTQNHEIAPIREHLIDCIKYKSVFSSVDFLVIIQAIEGFWWRFRDENYKKVHNISNNKRTSLKTIMEELISEFSDIKKLNLENLNIQQIIDSRHYFTHFVPKYQKPHTVDGWELYEISVKLRQLLICCILNFIGFNNSEINNITNKCINSIFTKF